MYVNDPLQRMLGTKGAGILDRIHFPGTITFADLLDTIFREGNWIGEATGLTQDDHSISLDVNAHRLDDGPNPTLGAILVLHNTERNSLLERQIDDSEHMELVEKLSQGIVHEFKNILTILMAYGSLLQFRLKEEELHEEVNKIMETANRGTELVQQLSRLTHRRAPEYTNSDLEEVLREINYLATRTLPSQIKVHLPEEKKMPTVFIDNKALIRSVIHLALNGCEAMPGGGELHIACDTIEVDKANLAAHPVKDPGRYIMISVTDNGSGMASEVKQHLFEPFFTTKENGSGLGLSAVMNNIQSFDGFITISSEPGKGTCARIYLPTIESNK